MSGMSTMQLLRRLGDESGKDLDLVDNPDSRRPSAFESPGQVAVPRFGTDDLLLLADAMADRGYRLTWLDLRDERFNVVDEDDEEAAAGRLLGDLRRRDVTSALRF